MRYDMAPVVFNNVATAVRDVLDRSYMVYAHACWQDTAQTPLGVLS